MFLPHQYIKVNEDLSACVMFCNYTDTFVVIEINSDKEPVLKM